MRVIYTSKGMSKNMVLQFYYKCEKVFFGPLREVTLYQHKEQLGA
jgi:hypothetical protein